jgi:hypothetical protein
VFLDIYCLFISQILGDPDIKILKIHLPIMLGARLFFWAKNLQKATSFLKREYFVTNFFFGETIMVAILRKLESL